MLDMDSTQKKLATNTMTRRKRILTGTSAGLLSQFALGLMQLAAIPIFFAIWGPEKYGLWLILSTVPAYLALSDFGIFSTVTTQIALFFGAGNDKEGIRLFSDLQKLFRVIAVCLISISMILFALTLIFSRQFDILGTLAILTLSVAVSQFQGLTFGALRANGKFTAAISTGLVIQIVEWLGLILSLLNRGSLFQVASAALAFKVVAVAICASWATRSMGHLSFQFRGGSLRNLRNHLGNSLSALGLTLSNAVWIQGTTLVAGAVVGPAGAALLATYRTLSRLPLQITASFGQALWPEFSYLQGSGKKDQLWRIYSKFRNLNVLIGTLVVSTWLGVCSSIFPFLTSNKLTFVFGFGVLFSLAAWFGILAQAPRTLLLGTNTHLKLGYLHLAASLAFLPILGLAGQSGGIEALIWSLVIGEVVIYVITSFALKSQFSNLYGESKE